MTSAEQIILSGCARVKIRSTTELARRAGMPVSSMRYKMNHPETIRVADILAWDQRLRFTNDEIAALVRGSRRR